MNDSGCFPAITAWSRAFVHLERTLADDEAVWLVEDDVRGMRRRFAGLVCKTAALAPDLAALALRTRGEDGHWPH